MNEELRNLIDSEYDKIEIEDASSDYLENINKQIKEQNTKVEEEIKNSTVVRDYLQKHNKDNINDLTSTEINELLNNIDNELNNME